MPRRHRDTRQYGGAAYGGTLLSEPNTERTGLALLRHVLVRHPKQHLTIPALVEAVLGRDSPDFGYGAELECAIRDYVSEGILWLKGGEVWPTQLAFDSVGATPPRSDRASPIEAREGRLDRRASNRREVV